MTDSTSQVSRTAVLVDHERNGVIAVRRVLVRVCGGIDAAFLLSQLLYWHGDGPEGPRATIERDGATWVAKSERELSEELGLLDADGNVRQNVVRRIALRLVEAGLIETRVWKWNGSPTTHYAIRWDALADALGLVTESDRPRAKVGATERHEAAETDARFDESVECRFDENVESTRRMASNPIYEAETTSENTTPGRLPGKGPKGRARGLGPGASLYRDVAHLTPNHVQREILDEAHAELGEERLREAFRTWVARGWSRQNVDGMVDFARKGDNGPPGRDGGPVVIRDWRPPE